MGGVLFIFTNRWQWIHCKGQCTTPYLLELKVFIKHEQFSIASCCLFPFLALWNSIAPYHMVMFFNRSQFEKPASLIHAVNFTQFLTYIQMYDSHRMLQLRDEWKMYTRLEARCKTWRSKTNVRTTSWVFRIFLVLTMINFFSNRSCTLS